MVGPIALVVWGRKIDIATLLEAAAATIYIGDWIFKFWRSAREKRRDKPRRRRLVNARFFTFGFTAVEFGLVAAVTLIGSVPAKIGLLFALGTVTIGEQIVGLRRAAREERSLVAEPSAPAPAFSPDEWVVGLDGELVPRPASDVAKITKRLAEGAEERPDGPCLEVIFGNGKSFEIADDDGFGPYKYRQAIVRNHGSVIATGCHGKLFGAFEADLALPWRGQDGPLRDIRPDDRGFLPLTFEPSGSYPIVIRVWHDDCAVPAVSRYSVQVSDDGTANVRFESSERSIPKTTER